MISWRRPTLNNNLVGTPIGLLGIMLLVDQSPGAAHEQPVFAEECRDVRAGWDRMVMARLLAIGHRVQAIHGLQRLTSDCTYRAQQHVALADCLSHSASSLGGLQRHDSSRPSG